MWEHLHECVRGSSEARRHWVLRTGVTGCFLAAQLSVLGVEPGSSERALSVLNH